LCIFILCRVFNVCVILCTVFRLIFVLFSVMCVVCVLCLIVVPLPPGENPFAVKINNNTLMPWHPYQLNPVMSCQLREGLAAVPDQFWGNLVFTKCFNCMVICIIFCGWADITVRQLIPYTTQLKWRRMHEGISTGLLGLLTHWYSSPVIPSPVLRFSLCLDPSAWTHSLLNP
jgi:hypothetical protein